MRRLPRDSWGHLGPLAARAVATADEQAETGVIESLLEAMFLMAIADGSVCEDEVREFARACRELLGDITEGDIEGMFLQWAEAVAEEGWERRLRAIASSVAGTDLAEPAFRLAVAIALADHRVAVAEADGIDLMAQALGLETDEAQLIVQQIHRDLEASR